jgi:hypothetical protein
MNNKKGFEVHYLLLSEGTTEFNLFAYLKNKFRTLFDGSKIKFSPKVEIAESCISQGKLCGVSDIKGFRLKYDLIKRKYKGQKRFFFLDKDVDDSSAIEDLIKKSGDIVQFIEYNSEYLLLKFSGKNPKNPPDFHNLGEFRSYCKAEFQKNFRKKASEFQDPDFDSVFRNVNEEQVKVSFTELFSILQ